MTVEALLRSSSWHAENIFKQRGRFDPVLWLVEYTDGRGRGRLLTQRSH
jgi:hypothetical protein